MQDVGTVLHSCATTVKEQFSLVASDQHPFIPKDNPTFELTILPHLIQIGLVTLQLAATLAHGHIAGKVGNISVIKSGLIGPRPDR